MKMDRKLLGFLGAYTIINILSCLIGNADYHINDIYTVGSGLLRFNKVKHIRL